jgi:hypothetical protein
MKAPRLVFSRRFLSRFISGGNFNKQSRLLMETRRTWNSLKAVRFKIQPSLFLSQLESIQGDSLTIEEK